MNETTTSYMDRIRNAYAHLINDLGKRPGDWVTLTDLRPYIGGHRADVDEALRHLGREQDVSIIPESDSKSLTPADRDAAVVIGNQDKHLIAIDWPVS